MDNNLTQVSAYQRKSAGFDRDKVHVVPTAKTFG
jgi:hypothetical protein